MRAGLRILAKQGPPRRLLVDWPAQIDVMRVGQGTGGRATDNADHRAGQRIADHGADRGTARRAQSTAGDGAVGPIGAAAREGKGPGAGQDEQGALHEGLPNLLIKDGSKTPGAAVRLLTPLTAKAGKD